MAFSFGAAAPAPATGFTFGAAPAPAPAAAGFSFGAAPAPAPASSGFTFGATPAPAPAPASGFTFGSPAPAPAASGFTFGATPAPAPATSSGFTFGATPAPAPATGFTFGASPAPAPATSSGFSWGAPAPAPAPAAAGGFSWGAPAPAPAAGGFNWAGTGTTTTPAATAGTPGAAMAIVTFAEQLNTSFKTIFYNLKDPKVVEYQRPPELTEAEWEQAKSRNVDDRRFVPVPVIGFEGLVARVAQQDDTITKFMENAKELNARLKTTELAAQNTSETIDKLRHQRRRLCQRLLRVMEKVERLLARGKPWQSTEMELRTRLGRMLEELNKPSEFQAKLAELQSLQRMQDDHRGSKAKEIPRPVLENLSQCLDSQREGLTHLTEILRKDNRDLAIIMDSFSERSASGDWAPPAPPASALHATDHRRI